ncbi:MAG: hypothetical protein KDJ74_08260 [Notoacmeibacter sp.]|nr:hypothetical protein [Notoacmeibacter sp.]
MPAGGEFIASAGHVPSRKLHKRRSLVDLKATPGGGGTDCPAPLLTGFVRRRKKLDNIFYQFFHSVPAAIRGALEIARNKITLFVRATVISGRPGLHYDAAIAHFARASFGH